MASHREGASVPKKQPDERVSGSNPFELARVQQHNPPTVQDAKLKGGK
jgi:hypothetical protein